jgi:hypothetical protein
VARSSISMLYNTFIPSYPINVLWDKKCYNSWFLLLIYCHITTSKVPISWHCDQKTIPGHVIYCGRLDNKPGCVPGYFAAVMDPKYKGKLITPNGINIIGKKCKADDPTRVRTDGLGTPDFGMPVAIAE